MKLHPDRPWWDKKQFQNLQNLHEVVDRWYMPHIIRKKIETERAGNHELVLVLLWDKIQLDRDCNVNDNVQLQIAIIAIYIDIAKKLWLNKEVEQLGKIEQTNNREPTSHLKIFEIRDILRFIIREHDIYYNVNRWQGSFSDELKQALWCANLMHGNDDLHISHSFNSVKSLLNKEMFIRNPYFLDQSKFKFPYTEIQEVLSELDIKESDNMYSLVMASWWLVDRYKEKLNKKEMIWLMLTFVESEWNWKFRDLASAKEKAVEMNMPPDIFEYEINSSSEHLDLIWWVMNKRRAIMRQSLLQYKQVSVDFDSPLIDSAIDGLDRQDLARLNNHAIQADKKSWERSHKHDLAYSKEVDSLKGYLYRHLWIDESVKQIWSGE